MPHVDELLGPATLAAAGMLVAIAVQPVAIAPAIAPQANVRTVALPAVEVVARRTTALGADARAAKPQA